MKYAFFNIFILSIVIIFISSCNYRKNDQVYYSYKTNPLISNKLGQPVSKYSSYLPYDSITFRPIDHKNKSWGISHYYDLKMFVNNYNIIKSNTDSSCLEPVYFSKFNSCNYYFSHIKAPILWNYYLNKEIYRLTELGVFTITLEIPYNKPPLISLISLKYIDGVPEIDENSSHYVNIFKADSLRSILNELNFQSYPDTVLTDRIAIRSSSTFLFEVHTKSGYKAFLSEEYESSVLLKRIINLFKHEFSNYDRWNSIVHNTDPHFFEYNTTK